MGHQLLNGGLHLWPELLRLRDKLLHLGLCLWLLRLQARLLLCAGLTVLLKDLWLVLERRRLLLKGLQLLSSSLL